MSGEICISVESAIDLEEYGRIPIAFTVSRVLDVTLDDARQFLLSERPVDEPYLKDYDNIPGEGPRLWPQHFAVSNWGFLLARIAGRTVGGAAIAFQTEGLHMLEGRDDLAVLWDIRVSPEVRGQGVGRALFQAAESWSRTSGCTQLKVETQNTNVPACRFYQARGCVIQAINRGAYPEFPGEIQMLWSKFLSGPML